MLHHANTATGGMDVSLPPECGQDKMNKKKQTVAPAEAPTASEPATATPAVKKTPAKRHRQRARQATAREGSKKAAVLALLRKPQGATLPELVKATGWQAHSVRGFLSGSLRQRMGLPVKSSKNPEGQQAYRVKA